MASVQSGGTTRGNCLRPRFAARCHLQHTIFSPSRAGLWGARRGVEWPLLGGDGLARVELVTEGGMEAPERYRPKEPSKLALVTRLSISSARCSVDSFSSWINLRQSSERGEKSVSNDKGLRDMHFLCTRGFAGAAGKECGSGDGWSPSRNSAMQPARLKADAAGKNMMRCGWILWRKVLTQSKKVLPTKVSSGDKGEQKEAPNWSSASTF